MTSLEQLERRIADLEARQELLITVACAVADRLSLDTGHFAVLALNCGFTAQELAALHDFFGWAVKRDSATEVDDIRQNIGLEQPAGAPPGPVVALTREDLLGEFAARLPRWKDSLDVIMRAHQADGQFPSLCQIVLGEDSDSGQR